jgi:isopenicillin N synthase-like dioxygenase
MEIPVIDISPFLNGDPRERTEVAKSWDDAFRTIGFATIIGHHIPLALMESLQSEARSFFEMPPEEKMRYVYPGEQRAQGYVPMGVETVALTIGCDRKSPPPDLCESITFPYIYWERGRITNDFDRSVYKPNRWPERPARWRALIQEYSNHAHRLGLSLMRLSALALDLPEHYFDPFYDRMTTHLRFAYYPAQTEAPLPNQSRYGAHTDYSGYTMLLQDDAGGLQAMLPDGSWADVRPVRGGLVINSGDLIARWTNDRWKSDFHRVINPPPQEWRRTSRLSVVLFTGPNYDAVISCLPGCASTSAPPRYQPTTCWDHVMEKIRASMPDPL